MLLFFTLHIYGVIYKKITQVFICTPFLVYGLLALLITIGLQQTRSRKVNRAVAYILPFRMMALSLAGINASFETHSRSASPCFPSALLQEISALYLNLYLKLDERILGKINEHNISIGTFFADFYVHVIPCT
ncbi:hypothetical protein [Aeromonas popoffii]|jgi:hypothetical protein|uniref:hypothetical protein n=1 Tax=Aeromonas popoffii TaxID=70856 RepID=UPI0030CD552F